MVPSTPTPSARLVRAAAAERAELARHRERLLASRGDLHHELARIDASLREVDERQRLLDRLTGPADGNVTASTQSGAAALAAQDEGHGERAPALLRGPAIRRAAVQVLLRHPDCPEAMHYRTWFEAVRRAGFDVAGKDPLAVFLTQISRSPVVRKTTQAGVYALDVSAPSRLRGGLDRLHGELRALPATPNATADLAAIRRRRAELNAEIGKIEKALEEAELLLIDGSTASPLTAAI